MQKFLEKKGQNGDKYRWLTELRGLFKMGTKWGQKKIWT